MAAARGPAVRLRCLVVKAVIANGYPVQAVGSQRRKPFNLAQGPGCAWC